MALLYQQLLKIYIRFADDVSEGAFEENLDALDELGAAIIRIAQPQTVRDVMALPHEFLRRDGFISLIERDASERYDDIEGYVEVVIEQDVSLKITPLQHGFGGWELCEWIDQVYPYPMTDSLRPVLVR